MFIYALLTDTIVSTPIVTSYANQYFSPSHAYLKKAARVRHFLILLFLAKDVILV